MTGAALVRSDATAIPLGDNTVDLIVTSPPYFALRSYQDGGEHYGGQIGSEATPTAFLEALWAVTAECWRVLKPTGSLFVNLGDKYSQRVATRMSSHQDGLQPDRPGVEKDWKRDRELGLARMPSQNVMPNGKSVREKSLMGLPWRYAIGCIDGNADPDGRGWVLRSEIVWSKPNGLPESVTDRVRRSHEQWFHLTKEGRYYSNVDEVREPSNEAERPQARRAAELASAAGLTEAHREALLARGLGDTKKSAITKDGTGKNTAEVMRLAAEADAALGSYAREFTMSAATLGKLPGSVWTVPTQPLIVPDWLDVDHFAAFPTEWPRRLTLGWSPPGICVECGEGRRSVAEASAEYQEFRRNAGDWNQKAKVHGRGTTGNQPSAASAVPDSAKTITGTACACDKPTAPTTPAIVLDPFGGTGTTAMVARALGRYGVSCDLSGDYQRLAKWRIWQSGQAARVAAKTDGERQGDLFGGTA